MIAINFIQLGRLLIGPFDLVAIPNITSILLSWRQEGISRSMLRYNLSAVYVGPCMELLHSDPVTLTRSVIQTGGGGGMERRTEETFEGLVPHGSYMLTVTLTSGEDGQPVSASITSTTLSSSK